MQNLNPEQTARAEERARVLHSLLNPRRHQHTQHGQHGVSRVVDAEAAVRSLIEQVCRMDVVLEDHLLKEAK